MLRKIPLAIILGMGVFLGTAEAEEYYFRFSFDDKSKLDKITNLISIDNVVGDTAFAYANDGEMAAFLAQGYTVTILPHPGSRIEIRHADSPGAMLDWDYYPTYTAYVDMMNNFAASYPSLCRVQNIGNSVNGRQLLAAKISDNPDMQENEPEIFLTSTMHGDEVTGFVLMLRLIDYLLTNYGTDSLVTSLVDNLEIWINPNANPDGSYRSGNTISSPTRGNANGIDLNRNFPDPAYGDHPDGNAWQAETIAMMNFASNHSFVLSANFHGGAEVVNYPWDCWSRLHPDNSWFVSICRRYADSCQANSPPGYMDDLNNGITNGYAWYPVHGGRQDYMTYWKGGRENTIELSSTKFPSASQLPSYWNYNWAAFLTYMQNALYGIHGVVTDAVSGLPVAATIWVLSHDADSSRVFTDPDVGDYHRMIAPGTYNLRFSAAGYIPDTVYGVVVTANQATTVNVQLQPIAGAPDLAFVGHNAGSVMPGDTVDMLIKLINNGGASAAGVAATLISSDTNINIIQSSISFPTINPLGGTAVSLSALHFAVSTTALYYHQVDFSLIVTANGGYSDTLDFNLEIGRAIEDFETGNFASFPWQFSGNADWGVVNSGAYEWSYAAKSGTITHNQSSTLSLSINVQQAGTISFYYKVSSEAGYDSLKFSIDGGLRGGYSGEAGWAQASYSIGAGSHTLTWTYAKDGSVSRGSDCAWIDYIVFPNMGQPLTITTASLPDWTAGHPYSQQLQSVGGTGTVTWSDFYNNLPGTGLALSSSGLLSGIPNGPDTISFTAWVQDQALGTATRSYTFIINGPIAILTDSLPHAETGVAYSYQIAAAGGTGGLTFAVVDSGLDGTGLTLLPTGLLSGTPAAADSVEFTVRANDVIGASAQRQFTLIIAGFAFLPGDANGDGFVRGSDVTFLVGYFKGTAPAPEPYLAGDANGDCLVSGGDVTYLVRYFKGIGAEPIRGECR